MTLRQARLEAKLTQTQLAKRAGIGIQTVTLIELGKTTHPSPRVRDSLETALNRSINWEQLPTHKKQTYSLKNTISLKNTMEWKMQLEWIEQILDGKPMSDFALSFPLVRRVHDLAHGIDASVNDRVEAHLKTAVAELKRKFKKGADKNG